MLDDAFFMREAYKQAQLAAEADEVPVGAVIVSKNRIIARAHNQTERLQDVTAHAELLAITAAANFLGAKYLTGCSLYVTLEPCVMCSGALYWSQLAAVHIAVADPKRGFRATTLQGLHPKTKTHWGLMEAECQALLQDFFKRKRS
ncbi:MAG: nucleoside deaminase [Nitritalea sp.]